MKNDLLRKLFSKINIIKFIKTQDLYYIKNIKFLFSIKKDYNFPFYILSFVNILADFF